jgi:hypothetical protein
MPDSEESKQKKITSRKTGRFKNITSHFISSHSRKYTPTSAAISVFFWFIACHCSVFYYKAKVEGHKMGVNSSSQTSNDFELKQGNNY